MRIISLFLLATLALASAASCSSGDEFKAEASGGSGGNKNDGSAASSGTGGSGAKDGSAGKDVGAACTAAKECASGFCADGVCCDGDCTGACRSCKGSNPGKCQDYAAGLDPEGECIGTGSSTDPCAGQCDGKGACELPGGTKACGTTVCTDGIQTGMICNGAGTCTQSTAPCGDYKCGATSCLISCATDTECMAAAWCNTPSCQKKKNLGDPCTGANECTSGVCADGHCCNVACNAPGSCSTGQCLCSGVACTGSDTCINWYADTDSDGFGDKTATKVACSSQAPSGYVKDNTDCYDKNAAAKPGQTQYFIDDRGDNSFDYDCNTTEDPQYPNVTASSCKFCPFCSSSTACTAAGFGGGCPPSGCALITQGFTATGACGAPTPLSKCVPGKDGISGQCIATVTSAGTPTKACR